LLSWNNVDLELVPWEQIKCLAKPMSNRLTKLY